jgi:hypothetical protein
MLMLQAYIGTSGRREVAALMASSVIIIIIIYSHFTNPDKTIQNKTISVAFSPQTISTE